MSTENENENSQEQQKTDDPKLSPIERPKKPEKPEPERLYLRFMEAAFAGIMAGESGRRENPQAIAMIANGVSRMSVEQFLSTAPGEEEARGLYLSLMAAGVQGSMSSDAGRRENPQAIAMTASAAAQMATGMILGGGGVQAQPQSQAMAMAMVPAAQAMADIPPGYGMGANGPTPLPNFMRGMPGMNGQPVGQHPIEVPPGAIATPTGYERTTQTGAGGVKFTVEVKEPRK